MQQGETPREPMTRNLGELKQMAEEKNICVRCLVNSGRMFEVKENAFCLNCGLVRKPNTK